MLSKPKPNKKRKLPEKISSNQLTLDSFNIKGKAAVRVPPPVKASAEREQQLRAVQPVSEQMDEDGPEFASETKQTASLGVRSTSILPPNLRIIRCEPSAQTNDSVEANWLLLQRLIRSTLNDRESDVGYVTATRICENICTYGNEEALFEKLSTELQSFTIRLSETLNNISENADNFLESLNSNWKSYHSHLNILSVVFCQLDRGYILQKTSHRSLILMGKNIFREKILSPVMFRMRVINALLKLISKDRVSEISANEKSLIQEILQMLLELSYYLSDFEPRFLESAEYYYKGEAKKKIAELSSSDYIAYAQKSLDEESSVQGRSYLALDTKEKLVEVVIKQVILLNTQKIIDTGFDEMMDDAMTGPLARLYTILRPYSEITLLRVAFENYIKLQGVELIRSPSSDSTMIVSLLDFKTKIDEILSACFKTDEIFSNGLKESFEYFINTRGNKAAEMLAKFIDGKIKSSKQNGENMKLVNSALDLFRFINAKDAFEAYYKRTLAKRLLLNRSISIETESEVIQKLKVECGEDYTRDLEHMVNDIQISSDLTSKFSELNKGTAGFSMAVNVISKETWPSYPQMKLTLPNDMTSVLNKYSDFYSTKFNGRHLIWQNHLSLCVLKANFSKGQKNITASLAHCVILLLFNSKTTMTLSEIKSATGLEKEDLIRLLKSLSSGNMNILQTQSSGSSFSSNQQFTYNPSFESANSNLRITFNSAEQAISEEKDVEGEVAKDRQLQLDAAIVRFMKNKKTMSHSQLMDDIFKEVKYPIDANSIKKRIESLIDKGYLARDQNDSSVYNYLS